MSITSWLSKVRQQAGVKGGFFGLLVVSLLAACNTLVPEAEAKPDKEPVLALSPQGSYTPRTSAELIQALEAAVDSPGDDVVNLLPGATYILDSVHNSFAGPTGLPLLSQTMGTAETNRVIINGNGATIERSSTPGTPKFRLFAVNDFGGLILNEVTLRGGDVDGDGGAVHVLGAGAATINNSTLTGNRAKNGGAVFVAAEGGAKFINTTLSDNEAVNLGGGVDIRHMGNAEFIHTTVTGNKAGGGGAGVSADGHHDWAEGLVRLKSSVMAGNGPGGDVTAYDLAPGVSPFWSEGYNVIGVTASDAFTQPGDRLGTDPGLAALAHNGGPTATHALSGASPALDNVPADVCGAEGRLGGRDQRGSPRPEGPACDSGSFEGLLLQTQTITFAPLPDRTYGDAPFAVSASASSGLPISFAAAGSCSAEGSTVSLTGAGTCTITASQAGNDLYATAESVAQSFSVAKAAQTIVFGPLGDRTYGDTPFTVSASASSGLPVSFSASGPCTVSGSTIVLTGVGFCAVITSQAGDDDYGPAQDVSQTFSISYAFVGFARPLDNGVYNVAKAGRVVPLKWRITGSDGTPVTTLEDVSASVKGLSCDLGTTADQVEEYASGSSGLQNLGDGYYQFNWLTPNSYAKSCKTLNLHLGEATPRTALFRFVK